MLTSQTINENATQEQLRFGRGILHAKGAYDDKALRLATSASAEPRLSYNFVIALLQENALLNALAQRQNSRSLKTRIGTRVFLLEKSFLEIGGPAHVLRSPGVFCGGISEASQQRLR